MTENWVSRMKRQWVMRIGVASYLLLPIGFVVGVVLALTKCNGDLLGAAVGITLLAELVLGMIHFWLFYRHLKCPRCGYNPNKFKNGKNKPVKMAHTQLAKLVHCPNCNW